jgi:hypothetical protein
LGGKTGVGFMDIQEKACYSLGDLQIEVIHSSIVALRRKKFHFISLDFFQHMPMFIQVLLYSQAILTNSI